MTVDYRYTLRVNRATAYAFRALCAERRLAAGAMLRTLIADEVARSQPEK